MPILIRPKLGNSFTPDAARAISATRVGFHYKPGKHTACHVIGTIKGSNEERYLLQTHKKDGAIRISENKAKKLFPNFEYIEQTIL